jgi:F-type H+-transporting ATPase subunit b
MPQFDTSTFPQQLVWLAISFIVLYWLMAKLALPRVAEVLEKRRHRVDGNLDKASQLKAEAEAVMAAYEKALAEARHQAQLTMKETTERLAAEAAERNRQLAAEIAERTAAAERRIAAAKAAAMREVRGIAGDLARSTAARFTGLDVDAAAASAAVDEAMRGHA